MIIRLVSEDDLHRMCADMNKVVGSYKVVGLPAVFSVVDRAMLENLKSNHVIVHPIAKAYQGDKELFLAMR